MLTITKFVIAVALMSTGSAFAQSRQYLGPSNGKGDGATGILGFNELCQATPPPPPPPPPPQDVLRSGSPSATPNVLQWVMPTIVASVIDPLEGILVIDMTGQSSSIPPRRRELSCQGWSNPIDSLFGLAMTSTGSFSTLHCASDLPAACCRVTSGQRSRR